MSSDGPSLTILLAVTFLNLPSVQKHKTRLPQENEKKVKADLGTVQINDKKPSKFSKKEANQAVKSEDDQI